MSYRSIWLARDGNCESKYPKKKKKDKWRTFSKLWCSKSTCDPHPLGSLLFKRVNLPLTTISKVKRIVNSNNNQIWIKSKQNNTRILPTEPNIILVNARRRSMSYQERVKKKSAAEKCTQMLWLIEVCVVRQKCSAKRGKFWRCRISIWPCSTWWSLFKSHLHTKTGTSGWSSITAVIRALCGPVDAGHRALRNAPERQR